MPDASHPIEPTPSERLARRRVAARLQEIEGNPLDRQDIEMFEMFDREDWTSEQRRAHIIAQAIVHQPK